MSSNLVIQELHEERVGVSIRSPRTLLQIEASTPYGAVRLREQYLNRVAQFVRYAKELDILSMMTTVIYWTAIDDCAVFS